MKKETYLAILAFFSIYVFWGSTYLWNKIVVSEVPAFMLAGLRFTTAGLIIFLIAGLSGKSLKISKKQLRNSVLAGFFFLVYGNGVFVWSLKYVDSGFAALLAALQPLSILLLMRIVQKKGLKLKSIIGVALGLIGMYLLVSQREIAMQEGATLGIIMIFTCILSWSIGSLFVAQADLPKNFFITTGYQMVSAGILLWTWSLIIGETWSSPVDWSSRAQISMVCLIIFGGIAAFTSFNYLLKNVSTEKVATSAYINPVVALFLGWYFLDENITTQSIIAACVLLSGVYFINSVRKNDKTQTKKMRFRRGRV
ncbi:EamA family transporter [Dokdonia sp. Dokd-P16]|uniref:EamA family transporter n=1 Tax=Dokdonia sp. Dokd-P16 TaxID=2173169 RepID=UPI000D546DA2|nr:EamA family transporter [Dokdonia sp. Dokd-P16]AWH75199.1 EamA family transporter [Dokdonia sp. Dokd-P16]